MRTLTLLLISLSAFGQQPPATGGASAPKPDPEAITRALYASHIRLLQAFVATKEAYKKYTEFLEDQNEIIEAKSAQLQAFKAVTAAAKAYCSLPEPRPALDGIDPQCPPAPPAATPEKKQ